MHDFWMILIGVAIGWATKVPFLLRYYRRIKGDKEHMHEIVENYKKYYPPKQP